MHKLIEDYHAWQDIKYDDTQYEIVAKCSRMARYQGTHIEIDFGCQRAYGDKRTIPNR